MKKISLLMLSVLMASITTLTACSGAATPSSSAPMSYGASSTAMAPMSARGNETSIMMQDEAGFLAGDTVAKETSQIVLDSGAEKPTSDFIAQRKLVYRTELNLETKEFDSAIAAINQLVTDAGGYVEGQTVDGRSMYYGGDYYERYAQLRVRVPADRLSEVTGSIGQLCNIVSESKSIEDISDTYFDTQARLETLAIQEERLLEILRKAEKLEEVITLEKALSEVRYEIEALTAQIKRMDSQVTYSYLTMYLREVVTYKEITTAPKTFWEKLSVSFSRSGEMLGATLEGTVLFLVQVLPVLLLWTLIILAIVLPARKLIAYIRKGKTKPKAIPEPPKQAEE